MRRVLLIVALGCGAACERDAGKPTGFSQPAVPAVEQAAAPDAAPAVPAPETAAADTAAPEATAPVTVQPSDIFREAHERARKEISAENAAARLDELERAVREDTQLVGGGP